MTQQVNCAVSLAVIDLISKEYFRIRDERIISDHAKDNKSEFTYSELKEYIKSGLSHIRGAIAEVKTASVTD